MKYVFNENIQSSVILDVPLVVKIKIQNKTNKKSFSLLEQSLYNHIMKEVLINLCKQSQNCFFGYVISDHIYLLLLNSYNKEDGEMWYGGKSEKILSDLISRTTTFFINTLYEAISNKINIPVKENYSDPKLYINALVNWKDQMKAMEYMAHNILFTGSVFNVAKEQLAYYFTNQQNKIKNNFSYHSSMYCVNKSLLVDLPNNITTLKKLWTISYTASLNEIGNTIEDLLKK